MATVQASPENGPGANGATGRFAEEETKMPDGLVKLVLIGSVGFFLGAAFVGWVYG